MVIDVIFAVASLWGFYVGFSRGIIKTIFTILSVIFGLMIAFRFGPDVTGLLESTVSDNPLMFVAGFLLTFVLTMMGIRLFANMLEGALESANINFINQVIGGLFMAALMILLYSVLLWFGDRSHLINNEAKNESRTYVYLEQYPEKVWDWGGRAKPILEDFWDHSIEFMDKLDGVKVEREESDPIIYDLPDEDERPRR
ncbi:CvpA family protein [Phaeodactylibacter luteus]|uniref:CvpA family protein n=1 Tax=Phaeodactylibacter luteus TaxID=1564516 RepID=A0A5C6RL89_9BACT|nr:CvpA family protein [Phaeodactylibacter luteus]TXB63013.1 CvpA family protein [Phaeodactylibacter luteus]